MPDLFSQPTYFNTTNLKDEELTESVETAKIQDAQVLELFKMYRNMSPSQAKRRLHKDILLTSVRRAITTLTGKGLLTKTTMQVKGMHGKKEFVWSYNLKNLV